MLDPWKLANLKSRLDSAEEDLVRHPLLRTPTIDRIEDAADWLFRENGIRAVTLEQIAWRADTNTIAVLDCFGSLERLVVNYLKRRVAEQTRQDDLFWEGLRKTHPRNEGEQLREWIRSVVAATTHRFIPVPLSMEAIDFLYTANHPGRALIKQYKTAARDRLAQICCDAFYRDPEILADKLMMLVEGAFVQQSIFGGEGPAQRLIAATEDLFKRHWASV